MNSKPTSSLHKLKNYHFQERLGKGQYAQVMKAINRTTKTPCAIKVLDNLQIKLQPIVLKLLKSEISILQTVNNPNVVKLYEYLHENNHHYLVMEYCNGGDLEEYFKKKPHHCVKEEEAICFLKQLLNGFKALHQIKAMHRDFKLANVLIHDGVLKIADLGFSKQADTTKTPLGTACYMAPEIMKYERYNNKIDIWSLGVCMYEMLFGVLPFNEKTEKLLLKKMEENTIDFNANGRQISELFKNLIQRMLLPDPMMRINWIDIYNHDILKEKGPDENYMKHMNPEDIENLVQKVNIQENKKFYKDENNLEYDNKFFEQKLIVNAEMQRSEFEEDEQKPIESPKKIDLELQEELEKEMKLKKDSLLFLEKKYLHSRNIISHHAKVLHDGYKLIRNSNGIYTYFILAKRIVCLSNEFSDALIKKSNIFNEKHFEYFEENGSFEKIATIFKEQKLIYEDYFASLLDAIKDYQTFENPLLYKLKEEFNENFKNVDELFKEILLDYLFAGQIFIGDYQSEGKNNVLVKNFTKHLIELIDCFKFKEVFKFEVGEEVGFDFDKYNNVLEFKKLDELINLLNENINNLL